MTKRAEEYKPGNETERKILEIINKVTPTGEKVREIKNLIKLDGLITNQNVDIPPKDDKKRMCIHIGTSIALTGMVQEASIKNIKSCPYKVQAKVLKGGPTSGAVFWILINSVDTKPEAPKEEPETVMDMKGRTQRIPPPNRTASAALAG